MIPSYVAVIMLQFQPRRFMFDCRLILYKNRMQMMMKRLKLVRLKRFLYPAVILFVLYATIQFIKSQISNEAYKKRLEVWEV
jgi:hypothetical protein